MKLKMYEEFKTNQEIEKICAEYGIEDYTINPDGLVDVWGDLILNVGFGKKHHKMNKLPLEFGNISGDFSCNNMGLTTLAGCPKEVGGHFSITRNNIITLEGCPKEVGGYFFCMFNNNLTSLEGLEDTIIYDVLLIFNCANFYSLDGYPNYFKGRFDCDDTPIKPIYNRYIKGSYIEGTDQLAQAIQFFNHLQVIEEGSFGWEISYRKLLEYLKRYKEFGKPTKEEVQQLVGDKYIVR